MNKFLVASLSLAFLGTFSAYAQNANQQHICGTDLIFQKAAEQNPALLQARDDFYAAAATNVTPVEKAARIIPVVFHIIHQGGSENISKAQIEDQIRILNLDFRRLNTDASNTPSVWQGIAADANIEFRLANIDPQGNCTDGIVRVYSPLTNNASDNSGVKALSYWNRQKYLNIWVVKTIANTGGASGVILGYAQLPYLFFGASTDGVVLRSDCVGSIGSSLNGIDSNGKGRTGTHEVGHWLGLRHIWGDSNCGNDGVNDTPVHTAANSGCPAFPKLNNCSGADANGEMFMNYMDYTSGICQNMFSAGQKSVMDLTLSTVTFRTPVISQSNLVATGVLNNPPNTCIPKPEFSVSKLFVCEGAQVSFKDETWNGTPTQWDWQFSGGSPSSSTEQNPVISYNTPGVYDVTLTASNGQGNNTLTKQTYVYVSSNTADQQNNWDYTENFEDQGYFNSKWIILNQDNSASYKWQFTPNQGYSSSAAAKVNNFGGSADRLEELISPSFNFSSLSSPVLKFKLAYARANSSSGEVLKVFISSDCGQSWTQRYIKTSSSLSTTGANVTTSFAPTDNSQWREETVSIPSSFYNKQNVRVKFSFTSDAGGNNLYIDDINIANPTGISQAMADNLNFNANPNPSDGNVLVSYNLIAKARTDIRLYDIVGKEVKVIAQGNSFSGTNQLTLNKADFPAPGIYLLQLIVDNSRFVKRLVITQ